MKLGACDSYTTPKGRGNRKAEIIGDKEGLEKLRDAIIKLLAKDVEWLKYAFPYQGRIGQGDARVEVGDIIVRRHEDWV